MKIAITGGSGRIGSAVTELALAQGHSVVSIDYINSSNESNQSNLSFIQADLTQYEQIEQALKGCEALVHLAAIPAPGRHPDQVVHNNNVVGSYNTLYAAVQSGITRICQASSVNATGLAYSRTPRFDYFPLDEEHPTYNEDPYSLSKWICEQQADSLARRYEELTISSLRFHWVAPNLATVEEHFRRIGDRFMKDLWGFTSIEAAARACLLSLTADFKGHEVFYIVAPITGLKKPTMELCQEFFPDVPVKGDLSGNRSFFDCSKAERLLGWKHDE